MMRSIRGRPRRAGVRGFTLTELMIVVAIMSILAAIAYPNYVDYVRKSRRADATSLIMRAANRQEQLYNANQNSYLDSMNALGLPDQTENGFYTVDVNALEQGSQWYTITATAQGDQVNDLCRVILLDSKGLKTAWSGDAPKEGRDVADVCW